MDDGFTSPIAADAARNMARARDAGMTRMRTIGVQVVGDARHLDTAPAGDDVDEVVWRGYLRQLHQRLNLWHLQGRLRNPEICFCFNLDDENAVARYEPGIIRISRHLIEGVSPLDPRPKPGYTNHQRNVVKVKLADTLRHEMAHQALDELEGIAPTGDYATDHGGRFRQYAVLLGASLSSFDDTFGWTERRELV